MTVKYLDDLVLWPQACSLCRGVVVHGSDELARFGLLAVQVEAVAVVYLLHVAEARSRASSFLLRTDSKHSQSHYGAATVRIELIQLGHLRFCTVFDKSNRL